MKKTTCILAIAMTASWASAESVLKPLNDKGYGTISGRVQSLSMHRDFDGKGNGANSSLGIIFNYTTPEFAGFDAGLGYNYAGEIYENNNTDLLANDAIHILNEGWIRYNFRNLDLTNTTVLAGRKIINGEVFRADDVRQKSRSLETIMAETGDISNTRIIVGHAIRMSNWIQKGDLWEFNDFPNDDGVTWGEVIYSGIEKLEISAFDAIAWDAVNLIGARAKYDLSESTSILAYLRNESDVGDLLGSHEANIVGLSAVQKIGSVNLEAGYFGVYGDKLQFQETTTGINHALGASMMIYADQFNGDSDTLYLKAKTQLDGPKTILYALYNYTFQDKGEFDAAQELNLVVKQPIIENLSVAFKYAIGQRDMKIISNTMAQDARVFITYKF